MQVDDPVRDDFRVLNDAYSHAHFGWHMTICSNSLERLGVQVGVQNKVLWCFVPSMQPCTLGYIDNFLRQCWWRVSPERTNTTTVRNAHQAK